MCVGEEAVEGSFESAPPRPRWSGWAAARSGDRRVEHPIVELGANGRDAEPEGRELVTVRPRQTLEEAGDRARGLQHRQVRIQHHPVERAVAEHGVVVEYAHRAGHGVPSEGVMTA